MPNKTAINKLLQIAKSYGVTRIYFDGCLKSQIEKQCGVWVWKQVRKEVKI